jgi:hypothetical protein
VSIVTEYTCTATLLHCYTSLDPLKRSVLVDMTTSDLPL